MSIFIFHQKKEMFIYIPTQTGASPDQLPSARQVSVSFPLTIKPKLHMYVTMPPNVMLVIV